MTAPFPVRTNQHLARFKCATMSRYIEAIRPQP